ncbi:U2 snRNP component IST3 [Phyllosticta citribraziliensis]|uniref:U2 snRNP component IST3 n=1 Tax=Phyllosticta citribraziliensis TaxID=989973 RepID=A0ABR1LPF3_9PEZI
MNTIRSIKELNKRELEAGIPPEASWHADYRDTAYVYIGGLPFNLSEGDIVTIFSQYGEPVHIHLIRDKETGKSKGFCFLKYEDQRSCDLAVDNLSGAEVMGRILRVDHTRYKKKEGKEGEEPAGGIDVSVQAPEPEDESSEDERPVLPEEKELARLLQDMEDDDPMKGYMVGEKKKEVEEAVARWKKANGAGASKKKPRDHDRERRHRHHHRSRRERDADDESEDDRHRRRHRRHRSRTRSPPEDPASDAERRHRRHRRHDDEDDYAERKTRKRDDSDERSRERDRRRERRRYEDEDEDDRRDRDRDKEKRHRGRDEDRRRDRDGARRRSPS